jgi:hypothetical protein
MPAQPTYVTTSWDDGHKLDLRLADELAAHGLPATFYISPMCCEIPEERRLTNGELRRLADGFEIGGHTLTHPRLPTLTLDEARREIVEGKSALEEAIGQPVTSFCYPGGAYNADHPDLVRSAGFTSARTVERYCTQKPKSLFEIGTTIHGYRHLVDGPQIVRRTRSIRHAVGMFRNWEQLGRTLLEETRKTGGIFHLWGHSWEIDVHDDWSRLRTIFAEMASHDDVVFVTNGELAEQLGATP